MPVFFSLCAATAFGTGDFLGGLAARRAPALATAFLAQLTGLVLLLAWVPWQAEAWPEASSLGWGVVAGLTGGIAALTLYPALALGSASEVAPLSAVIGTALPVLFGFALGERPSLSAWIGIGLAALTIVLVSADGRRGATDPARRRRALVLAATSGVFIGAFLIAFERAGDGQAPAQRFVPLLVARATSVPLFALALALRRMRPWPAGVSPVTALASGASDIGANACTLVALAGAPLGLVVTLVNLYPAVTVLLGMAWLGDRPRPVQRLGLALALVAIVFLTR